MSIRTMALFVVGCFVALAAGVAIGHAQATSQFADEAILRGADLGFRVEGRSGDVVTGTLLANVDGKWLEVRFSSRARPIK